MRLRLPRRDPRRCRPGDLRPLDAARERLHLHPRSRQVARRPRSGRGREARKDGVVYYVDVFVRRATRLEQLLPFTRPDGATIVPERALLPEGTSNEERDRENAELMRKSEVIASAVALSALGYDVRATPRGAARESTWRPTVQLPGSSTPATSSSPWTAAPTRTPDELRAEIGRRKPGEDVRLTVRRGGERVDRDRRDDRGSPSARTRPIVGILVDQDAKIELPVDVDIDLGAGRRPLRRPPVRARDRAQARTGRHPRLHRSRRPASSRSTGRVTPGRRAEAEDDRRAPYRMWMSSSCRPGRTPRSPAGMRTTCPSSL